MTAQICCFEIPDWVVARIAVAFEGENSCRGSLADAGSVVVVEGIDGAGKTTIVDRYLLKRSRYRDITLLRLGQLDAIPESLRPVYENHIISVVRSGQSFAAIHEYLLEIAELDALLYKIRLRAARNSNPNSVFLSDSWAHRRLCKFVALALLTDRPDLSDVIDRLLLTFQPVVGTKRGLLVEVDPQVALKRKGGAFTPWETVSGPDMQAAPAAERFLQLASATAELLRIVAFASGWSRIDTTKSNDCHASEYLEPLQRVISLCRC